MSEEERRRDPGEDDYDENEDEGFEDEDSVGLTPERLSVNTAASAGPDEEDDNEDDEGFGEEPDWVEKDDNSDRETR